MTELLSDLIRLSAARDGAREAVAYKDARLTYRELDAEVDAAARGLLDLGLSRGERVGIFLPKQVETVVAMFAAARAGGAFVPINPALKPRQVAYILKDCDVRILVTGADRLAALEDILSDCSALEAVIAVGDTSGSAGQPSRVSWDAFMDGGRHSEAVFPWAIDSDIAAILYTSGSTGDPKGVVLSHRNMVVGAKSVAAYLENTPEDRLLAALPLSFDYGLSQLTTAFYAGAGVVLLNYLLPRDVIRALEGERITGLACVPPLWVQLADLDWPEGIAESLRYVTNSGGKMPRRVTDRLRHQLPKTKIYLMYGLTEAFRSTYLPPEEVDRRPESIGKAIPYAEVLVVDADGKPCPPGDVGELVHRGALVAHGYWNDPERTAERFRPAPGQPSGITIPEIAVWSGDQVKMDEEGYLYFVGRRDEMIKTSGYRVSPTEVEEVVYASHLVGEAAAVGVPHPRLGQAIVIVASPPAGGSLDTDKLMRFCQQELPAFMVPAVITQRDELPRNPNGKIDRTSLRAEMNDMFQDQQ